MYGYPVYFYARHMLLYVAAPIFVTTIENIPI